MAVVLMFSRQPTKNEFPCLVRYKNTHFFKVKSLGILKKKQFVEDLAAVKPAWRLLWILVGSLLT